MLSPAGAVPPLPPPPAVGAWVDYDWQTPGQPKSRLRYAVVAGDASGRRRIEITVLKGDQLARFGYDLLADGSRERQVAQFGAQGPVVLMPTAPVDLPELPSVDSPKPSPAKSAWRRLRVPAGTFRCQEIRSVQGVACIDPGLMPMNLVRFEGKAAGRMVLMARGFDAQPQIVGTPRPLPQLDPSMIPAQPGRRGLPQP
ncbi:MAG: hypothetical protein VYB65_12840 [Myxococcota bacterium]|nr:hypothetical protein [Myxococcota bacterium]